MKRSVIHVRVRGMVYARDGRESFENLRTVSHSNGLWGVSPRYVNLVNMLNMLTKVLAQDKSLPRT